MAPCNKAPSPRNRWTYPFCRQPPLFNLVELHDWVGNRRSSIDSPLHSRASCPSYNYFEFKIPLLRLFFFLLKSGSLWPSIAHALINEFFENFPLFPSPPSHSSDLNEIAHLALGPWCFFVQLRLQGQGDPRYYSFLFFLRFWLPPLESRFRLTPAFDGFFYTH